MPDTDTKLSQRLCHAFYGCWTVLTPTGTDALELAFNLCREELGLQEIAVSAMTCRSSVAAAYRARVRLRWVDLQSDVSGFRHDWSAVPPTLPLLVEHFRGCPEEFPNRAQDQAMENPAPVIEDCAMTFGGTDRGRAVGQSGSMTVMSFGTGKAVDAGGGGALVIRDARLVRPAAALAGFHAGSHPNARNLSMPQVLRNCVMTALDAHPLRMEERRRRVTLLHDILSKWAVKVGHTAIQIHGFDIADKTASFSELNLIRPDKAPDASAYQFRAMISAGIDLYPWAQEIWPPTLWHDLGQQDEIGPLPKAEDFRARAFAVGSLFLDAQTDDFERLMDRLTEALPKQLALDGVYK